MSSLFRSLFYSFYEVSESVVQFDLLLLFPLFLFKFIHISLSLPSTSNINIISNVTSFLKELNILDFLCSNHDLSLKMEMNDNQQLIFLTRLEEGMFDIRESYVNVLTLLRSKSYTILMDFKVSNSLFANNIWSNY